MMELAVLVVDDEVPFTEALARRLDKRGFRVATAASGQQALEVLEEGGATRTDVVVLDVKMPGMDGLETLAAIKERHPLIEVIMLTGHATVESAIEGMKRGAFDYLMKPCDMEILTTKLNQAGQRKRDHESKILEARAALIALRRGD